MRLSIEQYALGIARVVACRSEDPYLQVGAVAFDHSHRIIATGYNGLAPGVQVSPGFWEDRENRRKFMIHAEQNMCSMFTRHDNIKFVVITHSPCVTCLSTLVAHGVDTILYDTPFRDFDATLEIAQQYGTLIEKIT